MQATVAKPNQTQTTPADPRAGKYLIFHLSGEEFAIPVLEVREIIGIQNITSVPQTPGYVKGVINLRGKVIPVIDLRASSRWSRWNTRSGRASSWSTCAARKARW